MNSKTRKEERTRRYCADLAIVGGGMAGSSAAVAAARLGLKTILVQNRPCLGGPAGTECDSDSDGHLIVGGSNWTTRDARETGPIEEFRLTQERRYRDGWRNSFSQVLKDICLAEKNLILLMNTEVFDVQTNGSEITEITAKTLSSGLFCKIKAPLFLDCSGDGDLAYFAGADFRMGREAQAEFGEPLAPPKSDPFVLGSSIYFRAVNTGHPVKFTPPAWAVKTDESMFLDRPHRQIDRGYWWLECGGDMDTITDNEAIYQKLLATLYGIWDHLKNGGDHGAENYAIEWISPIPAKRESRRIMGNYILTEKDILSHRKFDDAVAYAGGNVDIHPVKGFFSGNSPCGKQHGYLSPGLYQIPLRSLFSQNVKNLLMAGRNISVSHVALSSTRMMGTCSILGQAAAGMAFLCKKKHCLPAELGAAVKELQQILYRIDHTIPGVSVEDEKNLCNEASVKVSSSRILEMTHPGVSEPIVGVFDEKEAPSAISFPASTDHLDAAAFFLKNPTANGLAVSAELVREESMYDFASGEVVATASATLPAAFENWQSFSFSRAALIPGERYYIRLIGAPEIQVFCEECYLPGVWKSRVRCSWPPQGDNQNLCVKFTPAQHLFEGSNLLTTANRGGRGNCIWISDPAQSLPQWAEVTFKESKLCGCVEIVFDTNLDHINIFDYQKECVADYRLEGKQGSKYLLLADVKDNFLRFRKHEFAPQMLDGLRLTVLATRGAPSARIYQLRAYSNGEI